MGTARRRHDCCSPGSTQGRPLERAPGASSTRSSWTRPRRLPRVATATGRCVPTVEARSPCSATTTQLHQVVANLARQRRWCTRRPGAPVEVRVAGPTASAAWRSSTTARGSTPRPRSGRSSASTAPTRRAVAPSGGSGLGLSIVAAIVDGARRRRCACTARRADDPRGPGTTVVVELAGGRGTLRGPDAPVCDRACTGLLRGSQHSQRSLRTHATLPAHGSEHSRAAARRGRAGAPPVRSAPAGRRGRGGDRRGCPRVVVRRPQRRLGLGHHDDHPGARHGHAWAPRPRPSRRTAPSPSADTDDLSFGASGTVTAVNVAAGDKVTTGQVLATIDSASLESDVESAESDLADAEATLADDRVLGCVEHPDRGRRSAASRPPPTRSPTRRRRSPAPRSSRPSTEPSRPSTCRSASSSARAAPAGRRRRARAPVPDSRRRRSAAARRVGGLGTNTSNSSQHLLARHPGREHRSVHVRARGRLQPRRQRRGRRRGDRDRVDRLLGHRRVLPGWRLPHRQRRCPQATANGNGNTNGNGNGTSGNGAMRPGRRSPAR